MTEFLHKSHLQPLRFAAIAALVVLFGLPEIVSAEENRILNQAGQADQLPAAARHSLTLNPFARSFRSNKLAANGSATSSADAAAAPFKAPKLRAVLYAEKAPLADVSGKIVGVGENYDGYTVKVIGRDYIKLEKSGQFTELNLQDATMAGTDQ